MADRQSRGRPRAAEEHVELHVGIADEDSYLRNEFYPSGVARGWRRTGCILAIALAGGALVLALVIAALAGA